MDGAGASAQSSLVRSLEGRLGALFAREAVSNQTKLVSTLFFSLSPDTTPPLRSFGSSTTHAPLKKEKTGEKSERKRGKSARAFYRPSSPRFELENKKKVIWFSSTCAFFFFFTTRGRRRRKKHTSARPGCPHPSLRRERPPFERHRGPTRDEHPPLPRQRARGKLPSARA